MKSRILFIDDHEDTCHMVIAWLGTLGYEVTATHSVSDGIRMARGGGFDLYLLDSRLADGDGKELCERLREFDPLTPIVFYAGDIRERVMADSDCETQGFAMKPELEKLPSIISNALDRSQVGSPAQ
jgi:two-component system, cell cycle sensor histidine kinase and response regulator CckA